MSVLDDPPIERDGKAGYSTICRAGDHKTCAMAKARCSCDCHGRNGQAPPPPRAQEQPAMSEATVTTLPSKPVAVPDRPTCDECGYVAVSTNGLAVHRGRAHGTKAKAKPAQDRTPPEAKPTPRKRVSQRELLSVLAVTYHELAGADVATAIESAGSLVDALVAAGWQVVEQ